MRPLRTFLLAALTALFLTGALAAGAGASPVWSFEGTTLSGEEDVVGTASQSSLTIPGLTTECEVLHYGMRIKNVGTTASGELRELSFKGCFTDSAACTVKAIGAEALPWPLKTAKVVSSAYVVLSKVKVAIVYAGAECPLTGIVVTITGSAGGLFENATSTMTFDSSSFLATKTELQALKTKVEWAGKFPTEATGGHKGEALELT